MARQPEVLEVKNDKFATVTESLRAYLAFVRRISAAFFFCGVVLRSFVSSDCAVRRSTTHPTQSAKPDLRFVHEHEKMAIRISSI